MSSLQTYFSTVVFRVNENTASYTEYVGGAGGPSMLPRMHCCFHCLKNVATCGSKLWPEWSLLDYVLDMSLLVFQAAHLWLDHSGRNLKASGNRANGTLCFHSQTLLVCWNDFLKCLFRPESGIHFSLTSHCVCVWISVVCLRRSWRVCRGFTGAEGVSLYWWEPVHPSTLCCVSCKVWKGVITSSWWWYGEWRWYYYHLGIRNLKFCLV